jgi:hypothetical protein
MKDNLSGLVLITRLSKLMWKSYPMEKVKLDATLW